MAARRPVYGDGDTQVAGDTSDDLNTTVTGRNHRPASDRPDSHAPGKKIGEYEIVREVGRGGMGTVYEVVHPIIGRRAAAKIINPLLSADRILVDRFIDEARAAVAIGHPNIIDVFAFGYLSDGQAYIIMEWIDGQTLLSICKDTSVAWKRRLDLFAQLVRTVEAAHKAGIIHRDLKPENIMVSELSGRDHLTLLDFGIAKLVGDLTGVDRTETGALLGTPGYLAPEQARGQRVDEGADVYSLGIIGFELFTSTRPFNASNAVDMLFAHAKTPPPLASDRRSVPPQLDQLLLSMMAKDAADRPKVASVVAVLDSLGELPEESIDAKLEPAHAGKGSRALVLGMGLAVVAGMAALALVSSRDASPKDPVAPLAAPQAEAVEVEAVGATAERPEELVPVPSEPQLAGAADATTRAEDGEEATTEDSRTDEVEPQVDGDSKHSSKKKSRRPKTTKVKTSTPVPNEAKTTGDSDDKDYTINPF